MKDLLKLAVDAHGGLDRWNTFTRMVAPVSISGAIWDFKQQPGLLLDKTLEIDTQQQKLSITPFTGADLRSTFVPGRLAIETLSGKTVEEHENPLSLFEGHTFATPWNRLHVAYFVSEALWTYLTLPFLYTYPGFVCEEIAPWREDGEEWRRLKVQFPSTVESHTREQVTYFGPDGLMRRHDYTVDILQGNTGANYSTEFRDFQGIKLPTRRRIYAYDAQGQKVPEPLLVSLDFGAIALR